MVGLGDVVVVELVGPIDGLDGRCAGKGGIKGDFGSMGWLYHLQKWRGTGSSRIRSLNLERLSLRCLLNSKWRCQVVNWIYGARAKHLGDFFAFR